MQNQSNLIKSNHARRAAIWTLIAATWYFATAAEAMVTSDFDADYGDGLTDGWIGISCVNPGLVCGNTPLAQFSHIATGGNPDGFVKSTDPDSGNAARIFAPTKFLEALQLNRRLLFDLTIFPDPNGGTQIDQIPPPIVSVAGAGRVLVYLGAVPGITTDANTPNWSAYDVLLNNTGNALLSENSWFKFDGAVGAASEGDFIAVFADPGVRLSITGEFINDGVGLFDSVGLDNVNLVPLPAALPLMLSALFGLGYTGGRTRR
jgi:hypothetical protein